jgi:hypothetical protein
MTDLRFDPQEHRYYLEGRELPGVTRVLRLAGYVDDRWWTNFSRDRGSAVHLACELDDRGILDEATVDPRIAGYLDAWRRFTADTGAVWEQIEEHVMCPVYRYAGTPDRIGAVSRCVAIVDIKTGDPGQAAKVQTAAYARAAGLTCDRLVVQLSRDGTYRVHRFELTTNRHDFAAFTAALTVLRWRGEIT